METPVEVAARTGGTEYLLARASEAGNWARGMGNGSPVAKDEFANWLWQYDHPDFPALYALFVVETRRIAGFFIPLSRFADAAFLHYGNPRLKETILKSVPRYL